MIIPGIRDKKQNIRKAGNLTTLVGINEETKSNHPKYTLKLVGLQQNKTINIRNIKQVEYYHLMFGCCAKQGQKAKI